MLRRAIFIRRGRPVKQVLKQQESMNSVTDLSIPAQSFMVLDSYGTMKVGDKALEYYDERNVDNYIQIPWEEIDHIEGFVMFKRKIVRFEVFTRNNGSYKFSTRDNIRTLRAVREHFPQERMMTAPSAGGVMKAGLKVLGQKLTGKRSSKE